MLLAILNMKRLSVLLCIITLGVFIIANTAIAQTSFSVPPKAYPANVPFKCDAGVDSYWHVTSITCIGRANGGYKFRIEGIAQKTCRSMSIDLFYLMPGNRIMTAGAYYFPNIEEGKSFSFEIVSAFTGYAPSKFNGFFISSEVLQRILLNEQEKAKNTSNNSYTRKFGMPMTRRSDTKQESVKTKENPNKVYQSTDKKIEKLPEFPGGLRAFMEYISKNIHYPWICKEQKIQGKVLVGFIVEKDGSVSNVTALKKVHANLDTEAIRVIKSSPKWKPGTMNGEPIRIQMAVYVNFKL